VAKLPGINHLDAVPALEKAGFRVIRKGKHIVMSSGERPSRVITLKAFTMSGIVKDAGLSADQCKALL
jgi:predicted RNA binding protein YcfA (HicA-like mRNA interferase family)